MTISIMVERRPYASPKELTSSKITLLGDVFRHFGGHFEPKKIEVWQTASDEALGGTNLDSISLGSSLEVIEALDSIYQKHKNQEALAELILILRGVWFREDAKTAGYIAMNNQQDWRDQYGDIEANIFQTDEYSDIVELLWMLKSGEFISPYVSGLIDKFHDYEIEYFDVGSIIYSLGIPQSSPVYDWRASYFKRPDFFLARVLSTMEEKDKTLKSYIRLANRNALMSELYGIGYFKEYLRKIAKDNNVSIDFSGSLGLVAQKKDSYKKLYDDLSSSLRDIIKSSLKTDDEITDSMIGKAAKISGQKIFGKEEFEGQKRIDQT